MGIKGWAKRLSETSTEVHESRVAERVASINTTPIADLTPRQRAEVGGEVKSMRLVPLAGSFVLEITLSDSTGVVTAMFTGRRRIPGMNLGSLVKIEGMAATRPGSGRPLFMNPSFDLLG